jgi:hypothetical protein
MASRPPRSISASSRLTPQASQDRVGGLLGDKGGDRAERVEEADCVPPRTTDIEGCRSVCPSRRSPLSRSADLAHTGVRDGHRLLSAERRVGATSNLGAESLIESSGRESSQLSRRIPPRRAFETIPAQIPETASSDRIASAT